MTLPRHLALPTCLLLLSAGCLDDQGRGGQPGLAPDGDDGQGGEGEGGVEVIEEDDGDPGGGGGPAVGEGEGEGEAPDEPEPPGRTPCDGDADCGGGRVCTGGFCGDPECEADGQCGGMLFTCRDGRCRDRCLGPGTCFRGGICVDGACLPPECDADADCGDPLKACDQGACIDVQACQDNGGCNDASACVDGRCQPLPTCGGDRNCGDDAICERGRCRARPSCDAGAPCQDDEDCVGGRCVPFVCRGHADCAAGLRCEGGDCVEPAAAPVARILVLTRGRTLFVGQELAFQAIALDAAGDVVATAGFTWESGDPAVVSVGADSGVAAARAPGEAEVRAGLAGPDGEPVWSEPVSLFVAEAVPPPNVGQFVRITSAATGAPIEGAVIVTEADLRVTDADGRAHVGIADDADPLTVFAAGHDTATVVGTPPGALHIPLPARTDVVSQAGFTGGVSLEEVTTEGPLEIGLAGASLSSGFTHFDLGALIGEVFNTSVGAFGRNFDLPLPGGLTLSGDLPLIGYTEVKTEYSALAEPGFRIAWSFGGRMEVGGLIQQVMGGGFDVGTALTELLPWFESFEHGVRAAPGVVALPRIVDERDVDRDGDVSEFVPDYRRFPVLDQRPDHAQRLRVAVTVPAPPAGRGGGTDATLVFLGTDVEGVGFVPLGVSSSTAAETIPMKMAAPHSGLEGGTYAVVALSSRIENSLPREVSALVSRHDRLPEEVGLGAAFLPFPGGAEWTPAERTFAGAAVAAADAHRAVLANTDGRWFIWFAGDVLSVTLPAPPQGHPDLAAGAEVRFEALALGGAALGDILMEDGPGALSDVDTMATGFSRILP